ncbi:MAG: tetratricopeptide repeat protein, partial [Actinomycetota bacterium]|nr:tetratricopeptide repeat protein [Actinomycetota bacterium]
VLISALAGAGGIGKTALALWWAHRNVDRFPDGQLFADLQGFSSAGAPVDPGTVVRGFLAALGGDLDRLPADQQAQAALYRSLVAGKRMLIVLDNVADTDQVTPLLPGSPSCMVLVTSRRHLTSLITRYGARHLPIGVLDAAAARRLLTIRIGRRRTEAEPAAVDDLLDSCGGFALALNVVAARAIRNPATPLAELAGELRDSATRLGTLDDDEPTASLPAVLSWSLKAVTGEQEHAFALLGIAPGTDIGPAAAACLLGLPAERSRRVLRALADASLLEIDGRGRYSMHNLVRDYARVTAAALSAQDRTAALQRVVDFYLHTAYSADRLFYSHRPSITLAAPPPGTFVEPLPDAVAALAWFRTEHTNLVAAVQLAAGQGWAEQAWQLAWAMTLFLAHQGHKQDRLTVWRAALAVVGEAADPATRVLVHRNVGRAYAEVGRHDDAIEHLERALSLAERHDDVFEQAYVHGNLMWAWMIHGDFRRALEHGLRNLHFRQAIGDPGLEANALHGVGRCAALLGDYDLARAHSQAALVLHRRLHHAHGEAAALCTLGYIDSRTGRHREAAKHYERAIALFQADGNIVDATTIMELLGRCHLALGDHGTARAIWREALALYQGQGRTDMADGLRTRLEALDD